MRELPEPDKLLLPRDNAPILYVPAQTWKCILCDPDDLCVCGHRIRVHFEVDGNPWCGGGSDFPGCYDDNAGFEIEDDPASHRFERAYSAVAVTTVVWLGPNTDGPHGRCSTCGQKYELARANEAVPPIAEQGPL